MSSDLFCVVLSFFQVKCWFIIILLFSNMAFKYDVISLIELVESKPCLWDKFNENNKNKILREKSWQEIFSFLDDEYDQLTLAEKKNVEVGTHLNNFIVT